MESQPQQTQVLLLKHEGVGYEDQVVYATGNAYVGCEFKRCVIIFKGFPIIFDTCEFYGCVWHVDVLIHDQAQFKSIQDLMDMIGKTLPAPSSDGATPQRQPIGFHPSPPQPDTNPNS